MRAAAWMVAIRWCIRGLDVVVMVVLARLLAPEDFGLYATGILIVGLLEITSQAGIDLALIRNPATQREHYDAAWTIQIIQGVAVALVLLALAPLLAGFFDEPRTVQVVQFLALRPLIHAFTNIGVVRFLKDLDYRKEFWFGFYKKTATVSATLILALILHNYLAMVFGVIAGALITVALSYRMHPYRPCLSLTRVREIWSFSGWILIYYAAEDIVEKVDRLVVGNISSSASLGQYQVGSMTANLPLENLTVPLWRALFPVYAKQTHDLGQLVRAYLNVLGFTAFVSAAVGFGMVAVAEDLVVVFLGEKWRAAVAYVEWLALVAAIGGVVDSAMMIILVTGHARLCAFHSSLRLVVILLVLPYAGLFWGTEQVAAAYFAVALCLMPIPFFFLVRVVPVSGRAVVQRLWRPIVGGIVMLLTVKAAHADTLGVPELTLALDVALGAATYIVANFALWFLVGRPHGPEVIAVKFLSEKIGVTSTTASRN